ncbi:MAG: hypothetical protein N4A57_02625 [Anaeromicrobium sp.]|jgi:hypothetical protein|uniref:hypothetical protein n=1 Tax=Anaeromicrobium sp. TaxID=1929132 RepID=UPI0025D8ECC3|nr:hypothetical protein [Anaeromicrobium sp.]MCT4593155.1 hypothetical protein [Anaeromicrobium sp.]
MKRQSIELDNLFPQDIKQYYEVAHEYLELQPENFRGAFKLSQMAWALADRWNDILANISKLDITKGTTKSELQKYCYGKYRQMKLIHEHCRSIWRLGEDINKFNAK